VRGMSVSQTPRHRELLDELVELVLAEGFGTLTIADLAQRLRCSKSTLYGLGHSKEQVLVNVLVRFFQRATERIEGRIAIETEPDARIVAYLRGVADELRPASTAFMADLAGHPSARDVYRRNTRIAARRVRQLVDEGAEQGAFRPVHAAFVADAVATVMARIQSGDVAEVTGLTDAQAYDELALLVLNGIRS
jgi:AcrR family transcriptional regulator